MELINVARLERRIQALENTLSTTNRLLELQSMRLDAQLARINELEMQRYAPYLKAVPK